MASDSAPMATTKDTHRGHRDALAAHFRARPHRVIRWQALVDLVGLNFMQRISEVRTQLHMNIECVPRFAIRRDGDGKPHVKRVTGDYRFRPEALGRDAADTWSATPMRLPLLDGERGAYNA